MRVRVALALIVGFFLAAGLVIAGPSRSQALSQTPQCPQTPKGQRGRMRAAERNRYTVRRLEFYGNIHVPDMVLRRRILINEGYLFTSKNLLKSLERLNALKEIKPVRLSDVEIRLNHEDKLVDMVICFTER